METQARRRFRTKEERRRIVEETLVSGASVARVARAHGVNANQVFQWRSLYRAGRLERSAVKADGALLPVRVEDSGRLVRPVRAVRPGVIDIDLGHARVRIEGAADPAAVRAVTRLIESGR